MLKYFRVSKLFLMFGSLMILGIFSITIFIGDFEIRKDEVISKSSQVTFSKTDNQTSNDTTISPELASAVKEVAIQPQEIVRTSNFGENATNKLATSIAKEIIALNPNGPGSGDIQKLKIVSPNEVTNKLTADAISNFNPEDFHPHVSTADFKIIEDSKTAFETYLKGFFAALRNNFVGLNLNASGTNLSSEDANKMLDAYDKALTDLSKLEVPKSLIFIHQQELSLVMGQKKMFQIMAEYNRDPLQAILAINEGEGLEKDFAEVGKEIAEVVKKNGLDI